MSDLQQKFAMSKYASSGDRNKAMLEHIESLTKANEELREEVKAYKEIISSRHNIIHDLLEKNKQLALKGLELSNE